MPAGSWQASFWRTSQGLPSVTSEQMQTKAGLLLQDTTDVNWKDL